MHFRGQNENTKLVKIYFCPSEPRILLKTHTFFDKYLIFASALHRDHKNTSTLLLLMLDATTGRLARGGILPTRPYLSNHFQNTYVTFEAQHCHLKETVHLRKMCISYLVFNKILA